MANKIMNFNEFLQSEEAKSNKVKLESYFTELRKENRILSFDEWKEQSDDKFLFLTYDLIDAVANNSPYPDINNYLQSPPLGFTRNLFGKQLTNNCFVSFIKPIDSRILITIGNDLVALFSTYLPNFRIYLNITSKNEYYLYS